MSRLRRSRRAGRAGRVAGALGVIVALCLVGGPAASAHEQRQVGSLQFTVGWANEPTYVGEQNAVQLFLHEAHGQPIDDLGSPPSLHVQVIFGSQTSPPLDLEPSFDPDTGLGTHGEFEAAIIPTAVGNYTFHFYGTINGQPIDQRFTSGPTTFDTVDDPTPIEFPTKVPTLPDLGALANRLSPRVDRAVAAAATSANRADSAHTLALVAIIVGGVALGVGIVLGGGGLMLARRRDRDRRPPPPPTPTTTTGA